MLLEEKDVRPPFMPGKTSLNDLKSWNLEEKKAIDDARKYIHDFVDMEINSHITDKETKEYIINDPVWNALYLEAQLDIHIEKLGALKKEYNDTESSLRKMCENIKPLSQSIFETQETQLKNEFKVLQEKINYNYDRQERILNEALTCLNQLNGIPFVQSTTDLTTNISMIRSSLGKHRIYLDKIQEAIQKINGMTIYRCRK